jgi:hypothetical protein
MPRSVNHVASKARRKKILNRTKGYFGKRKNVWTVDNNTLTAIVKTKKEHSEVCGSPVSMRAFANMACRTLYLWVLSLRRGLNLIAKPSPTSQ